MITGWEPPHVLFASLAERVADYAARAEAEQMTVTDTDGGVTVVIGVTGFLTAVEIDARLRHRRPAKQLAGMVVAAIRKAEQTALHRRAELAANLGDCRMPEGDAP